MKKWSYKVIEFDSKGFVGGKVNSRNIEDRLNELGNQGWALVSSFTTNQAYGQTNKIVFTFKREIEETRVVGN